MLVRFFGAGCDTDFEMQDFVEMLHAILRNEFGRELPGDDIGLILHAVRETGYRQLLFGFAIAQLIAETMPDFASENIVMDYDANVIRKYSCTASY